MAKKVLRVNFLERITTVYGEIAIAQVTKTGGLLYVQGGCHQSESDGKGVSLSTYIHAIYGLVRQAQARSVLMIGCGGGTLATMLSAQGIAVTIVDINPASRHVARRYFGVPDSIPFHVEDGAAYLTRGKSKFDAIVLDAYHASEIPEHLTSPEFFQAAAARLNRRKGLLVANVFLKNDADRAARRLAATMTEVWPEVRMLDEPGALERNVIIMAGDVAALAEPWLELKPRTAADDIRAGLKLLKFQTLP
ncbi:Polyamine aminopropyltransferase [Alphaproteobacteria bacterium SO-S41]|nr:Polyamine aminopropyltransferase [Alphaproteobacteria bacterium SO-S41]